MSSAVLGRRRRLLAGVVLVMVTAASAGCQVAAGAPAGTSPGSGPTPADRASSSPVSAALSTRQLEALPVRPQRDGASYTRAAYGPRWADVAQTGCNTRDQLLYAAATPGTVRTAQQGRCPRDVLAGTWIDFYTGQTMTFTDLKDPRQAQAVTLDHLVALAEADRSGAGSWSSSRKEQFANDPANLRVTAGTVNSSKGDRDPASWQPPAAARCAYAAAYTAVKTAWQLAVDQAEHDALRDLLDACPGS